jgi:hypothetical protein
MARIKTCSHKLLSNGAPGVWITDLNIFFNAVHAGLPEGHFLNRFLS